MGRLRITQEAAREIVALGSDSKLTSIQRVRKPTVDRVESLELRPASIVRAWSKDENNVWRSVARFVDPVSGEVVSSGSVDVYAPCAGSIAPETGRAWIAWRGRWELVAQPPRGTEYQAGEGIEISSLTSPDSIVNKGVVAARIQEDNYVDKGTLYFDKSRFRWANTSGATGKKEVGLRELGLEASASGNVVTIELVWR